MRTPPLRRTVIRDGVIVVAVVLVVLDAFVFLTLRAQLADSLNDVLATRMESVRSLADDMPASPLARRLTTIGLPALIETPDGRQFASEPLSPRVGSNLPSDIGTPRAQLTEELPDGTRLTVYAGRAGVDATLRRVLVLEGVGTVAAVLLALLLIGRTTRSALAPLDEVASTAARIQRGATGERLRPDREDTELGQLAASFDRMLDQLEATNADLQRSEERSRRFLADAAHQLRTPIAGIRASVESLLSEDDPVIQDRLLGNVLRQTGRASRLLAKLLQLARLDRGRPPERAPTDVVALVADEVQRTRDLAPELTVELSAAGVGPEPGRRRLLIDAAEVREALANLLDNARRHARDRIDVRLSREDGEVAIAVEDDGQGLSSEAVDLVFERFATLDGRGGSGLGLPIARAIARAHDGDLVYEGGEFRMVVRGGEAGEAGER